MYANGQLSTKPRAETKPADGEDDIQNHPVGSWKSELGLSVETELFPESKNPSLRPQDLILIGAAKMFRSYGNAYLQGTNLAEGMEGKKSGCR